MRKKKDKKILLPPSPLVFDGIVNGQTTFDPLGSYTGRTPDRNEIPVQDADDL